MANFEIHPWIKNISLLSVGETGSYETYSVISKTKRYSLPGTSTQKIVIDVSSSTTANVVGIVGLDEYSTMTLTKYVGATPTALGTITGSTYAAEDNARDTFNALWAFSDESFDSLEISFTAASPATAFATVFVGALKVSPAKNFERGSLFDNSPEFSITKTKSASFPQIVSHLRKYSLDLNLLSESEYEDLDHAKYMIGDQFCLVRIDSSSVHPKAWMLCRIEGSGTSLNTVNSQKINLIEALRWR